VNKINRLVVGLAIVFLATSMAYAQMQGGFKQHNDKQREGILKELNLTPEQQQKLEENRKAQREDMAKLHQAIKEEHAKLQEELKNPGVTRSTVEPLVNEIKSLQAQLIDHRINGIFAVKEILTPEQFVKFNQMMDEKMKDAQGAFRGPREKSSKSVPGNE
jgi:Spy/CpxP family protein refolding chaperone